MISNVLSGTPTTTSATITWTTDIPSSSQVEYGTDPSYDPITTLDPTATTTHSVTISGLASATTYHFAVLSTAGGASAASSDGVFTTESSTSPPIVTLNTNVPSATLSNGNSITNTLTITNAVAGQSLILWLVDHGAGEFSNGIVVATQQAISGMSGLSATTSPDGKGVQINFLASGNYTIPITQQVQIGDVWGDIDDATWAPGWQLQTDWIVLSGYSNGLPLNSATTVVSRWITYALPPATRAAGPPDARWALLRSPPVIANGGTVTFEIDETNYALTASTTLQIAADPASTAGDGDFTQSLNGTLAAAASSTVAYATSTQTLTFGPHTVFPFYFAMTASTTPANKDYLLDISSPSVGAIDVTQAGVRLGSSTLPAANFQLGMNEAGGANGVGFYNVNYTYPGSDRLDWAASQGLGIVRIPIDYRNIQASSSKALNESNMELIDAMTNECAAQHLVCILDVHDFGYYYNYGTTYGQGLLGTIYSPNSAFANLWSQLAERYKSNPYVWFEIMNEPNAQSALEWVKTANAAAAAIRATGATNKILFQGSYYDGAWQWDSTDNNVEMLKVYDPGNNYAIEAHQYLDSDGSGSSATCVAGSGSRLTPFTTWLQTYDLQGIIDESGWADNPTCESEATTLLDSIVSAEATGTGSGYIGFVYWAAGPWWGNYMYLGEPNPWPTGPEPGQLQLLKSFL